MHIIGVYDPENDGIFQDEKFHYNFSGLGLTEILPVGTMIFFPSKMIRIPDSGDKEREIAFEVLQIGYQVSAPKTIFLKLGIAGFVNMDRKEVACYLRKNWNSGICFAS